VITPARATFASAIPELSERRRRALDDRRATFASAIAELAEGRRHALDDRRRCGIVEALQAIGEKGSALLSPEENRDMGVKNGVFRPRRPNLPAEA
jgi:hypothetical protein